MNFSGNVIKKFQLENLNKNSINSIEFLEKNANTYATCSDEDIILYNQSTESKQTLFAGDANKKHEPDEITYLKHFQSNLLFAANGKYLNIFDINQLKLNDKFKFCKDTINCIEIGQKNQVVTLGDDSGEIKLIDLRINAAKAPCVNLTLKKTLNQHKNICYTLKYHPSRDYELFSGSYDCSILKWDTRFLKSNASIAGINVTQAVNKLTEKNVDLLNVYAMTPCFVHSLFFTEPAMPDFDSLLVCGIENGLCLAFDPSSLELCSFKQLGKFEVYSAIFLIFLI